MQVLVCNALGSLTGWFDSFEQILESLCETGHVDPEKVDYCKEKFAEIHAALIQAMTNEKSLVEEAKVLKRRLDVMVLWLHVNSFPFSNRFLQWSLVGMMHQKDENLVIRVQKKLLVAIFPESLYWKKNRCCEDHMVWKESALQLLYITVVTMVLQICFLPS